MNQSIKCELLEYMKTGIEEMRSYKELSSDISEVHHKLFNEDYYIIGYYQAEQWMLQHNITAFKGIEYVHDYESFHFGEKRDYTDAEALVNMIVYIKGEELLYELESEIYAK
tara:strand:- start:313 stop:648 length:336 start_codon:yes stop_codon:yes gene_type:complete